jgi:hypothetical protein
LVAPQIYIWESLRAFGADRRHAMSGVLRQFFGQISELGWKIIVDEQNIHCVPRSRAASRRDDVLNLYMIAQKENG